MTTAEKHQLRIARQTLRYSDVGAVIMGGMTKEEARAVILKLTGKRIAPEPPDGTVSAEYLASHEPCN